MKISFVVPAHNEEAYLGRCLESILEIAKDDKFQTEIIVVNNASTDNTKKIAQSYAGVVVIDEPRKGSSQARQAGFEVATGDLIANVDADFALPKDWLQAPVKEFSTNPKLVAMSGPLTFYDLPKTTNFLIKIFYLLMFGAYIIARYIFRASSVLQGGNAVIRRLALEKIGGYNTNFKFYGDDSDLAHRLAKVGQVKFSFDMQAHTSGRRLTAEGKYKMASRYFINYLWTILFGKPFTENSIDVRDNQSNK